MKEIGSKIGQKPTPTPNFCNFFSLSLCHSSHWLTLPLARPPLAPPQEANTTTNQPPLVSLSLPYLLPSIFYCFPLSSCLRLRLVIITSSPVTPNTTSQAASNTLSLGELRQPSPPTTLLLFLFLQSEQTRRELIHILHCWRSLAVIGMGWTRFQPSLDG
jgi:hypothetical protein